MEIENKIKDDDLVILSKKPEEGDLVQYRYHPQGDELGLVMQTYGQESDSVDHDAAHIMWAINDEEDELFLDLQVVSSASVFYD
jgi:hypothetical protein